MKGRKAGVVREQFLLIGLLLVKVFSYRSNFDKIDETINTERNNCVVKTPFDGNP